MDGEAEISLSPSGNVLKVTEGEMHWASQFLSTAGSKIKSRTVTPNAVHKLLGILLTETYVIHTPGRTLFGFIAMVMCLTIKELPFESQRPFETLARDNQGAVKPHKVQTQPGCCQIHIGWLNPNFV